MLNLRSLCEGARAGKGKLLSVYLTAGFPELPWTIPLARTIFESGGDFLELGIPFSDPIADGPTIQEASTLALRAGTRLHDVFDVAHEIADKKPVLLMGYSNMLLAGDDCGILEKSKQSGVAGFIIPDLLLGEEAQWTERAAEKGLTVIPFVAPTTPMSRLRALNKTNAPFVYAVSVAGVTGERREVPDEVLDYLRRARREITLPLLVGFGVSDAASARRLSEHTDGVIVGSAVIRLIKTSNSLKDAQERVGRFVSELKRALTDK